MSSPASVPTISGIAASSISTATADARNGASCRVLEKAGLRREGVGRIARLTRGERSDEVRFGLLREEFLG